MLYHYLLREIMLRLTLIYAIISAKTVWKVSEIHLRVMRSLFDSLYMKLTISAQSWWTDWVKFNPLLQLCEVLEI